MNDDLRSRDDSLRSNNFLHSVNFFRKFMHFHFYKINTGNERMFSQLSTIYPIFFLSSPLSLVQYTFSWLYFDLGVLHEGCAHSSALVTASRLASVLKSSSSLNPTRENKSRSREFPVTDSRKKPQQLVRPPLHPEV